MSEEKELFEWVSADKSFPEILDTKQVFREKSTKEILPNTQYFYQEDSKTFLALYLNKEYGLHEIEWLKPILQSSLKEETEPDLVKELTEIRNKLYDDLPSGEIKAWDLIEIIKWHINDLDNFSSKLHSQLSSLTPKSIRDSSENETKK